MLLMKVDGEATVWMPVNIYVLKFCNPQIIMGIYGNIFTSIFSKVGKTIFYRNFRIPTNYYSHLNIQTDYYYRGITLRQDSVQPGFLS